MGRGVNSPHKRSDVQDHLKGVPYVSLDYGLLGEREPEEQVTLVLVLREKETQNDVCDAGPEKRN